LTEASPSFASLLREYRLARGIAQEALAEKAGLSRDAIGLLERGARRSPRRETIALLVKALNLSDHERERLRTAATEGRGRVSSADAETTHVRSSLPVRLTSFIGRQREIAEVQELLQARRLVTLTGTGGIGKTSLALEVALAVRSQFGDGVALVELATHTDVELVPRAIAAAFGVLEQPSEPLLTTLRAALRSIELLLVLDNCEHLADACAITAEVLLRACPRLRILATSRQPLNLGAEVIWRVPALTLPQPDDAPLGEQETSEAVQLFAERAKAVRPDLALTAADESAVAAICRRLDGIPLAIELAATRTKVLGVRQIAARLDQRFRLLTEGSRTSLPRHQTLRATLDWSHQLLSEAERALLRRLAVFAGGFTLEAAETVGAGEGIAETDVLDLLSALVNKSLVLAESPGEHERYRLLETIRQYAEEKLLESGEAVVVRDRHRDWYLDLAERAWPELTRRDQVRWLDRLDTEHDNLRAALGRCKTDDAAAEMELRLAGALGRYWSFRGFVNEGREWLDHALARVERRPSVALALALNWSGEFSAQNYAVARARALLEESVAVARLASAPAVASIALRHLSGCQSGIGHDDRAEKLLEAALAAAREGNDARESAFNLGYLGLAAMEKGELGLARHRLEQVISLARQSSDQSAVAFSLASLAQLEFHAGNLDRAQELFEAATIPATNLRWGWMVSAYRGWLARIHLRRGDLVATLQHTRAALRSARERGDRFTMLAALRVYAELQEGRGNLIAAARVYGLANGVDDFSAPFVGPLRETSFEERLAAVRAALGPDAFEAAWAEGEAMTLEDAVALAFTD
jgi:non-specific serine/threonine protein kinase